MRSFSHGLAEKKRFLAVSVLGVGFKLGRPPARPNCHGPWWPDLWPGPCGRSVACALRACGCWTGQFWCRRFWVKVSPAFCSPGENLKTPKNRIIERYTIILLLTVHIYIYI